MADEILQDKWETEWDDLLSKSTVGDIGYSHTELVLFDQCDLVELFEQYLGLNGDEVKVRMKARDGCIVIEQANGVIEYG